MSKAQQFEYGTYYRFSAFASKWVATCGVMNLMEENQSHWVLDIVASYIPELSKIRNLDYMLTIEVKLNPTGSAVFTISHENQEHEKEIVISQRVGFTDLKSNLKFWAICESPGQYDPNARTVLLLPEEY